MRTKLAFLLGSLLSGSLGAQLPDTPLPPPPPGLVAWWTFDEFQSDVCYDHADAFPADLVWDGGRTRGIIQRDVAARHHLSVATGDLDGDGRAESLHCDRKGWDGTIKGSSFTIAMWIAPESLEPLAPPASIVDCRTVTSDGTTNTVRGCAIRFRRLPDRRRLRTGIPRGATFPSFATCPT